MNSNVIVAADTADLCGEHPLWDERSGSFYWTDITGQRTHRLHADGTVELIQQGAEIAGFTLNEPGGFTVVNGQGVWLWDGARDWRLIAADSFNDCIGDAQGRLLAGSIHYDPARTDYPLGKLLSVTPNGETNILDEGFRLSNGLAFAPDNRTLYFVDSAARTIFAYDYHLAAGSASNRRVYRQFSTEDGLPDGLAIDAAGFLWCAFWFGGCVLRMDPDGAIERRVELPVSQTSSLAFGGPDLTDIYVTTAQKPDALELAPPAYDPNKVDSGGKLFRVNLGIAGLPAHRTRINPASH